MRQPASLKALAERLEHLGLGTLYPFTPRRYPLLSHWEAKKILAAWQRGKRSVKVSLDLGLSTETVSLTGEAAVLPDGQALSARGLKGVADVDNAVFLVEGQIKKCAIAAERYYKLVPVSPGRPPTLEIDGIRMHRTAEVTPDVDVLLKIRGLGVRRGDRVLDVCTGLGYTAILSLRFGASAVLSIEKDASVLRMAEMKPWSRGLSDERITLVMGDAYGILPHLPDGSFDKVVHDPPRFALAGELYSELFYGHLFRVLRPGGRLFHYVGQPGYRHRRIDLAKGVSERLRRVGFDVRRLGKAGGVVATRRSTRASLL